MSPFNDQQLREIREVASSIGTRMGAKQLDDVNAITVAIVNQLMLQPRATEIMELIPRLKRAAQEVEGIWQLEIIKQVVGIHSNKFKWSNDKNRFDEAVSDVYVRVACNYDGESPLRPFINGVVINYFRENSRRRQSVLLACEQFVESDELFMVPEIEQSKEANYYEKLGRRLQRRLCFTECQAHTVVALLLEHGDKQNAGRRCNTLSNTFSQRVISVKKKIYQHVAGYLPPADPTMWQRDEAKSILREIMTSRD